MPWGTLDKIDKLELMVKKQRDDFIKGKPVLLYKASYPTKKFVSVWYNKECIGVGKCSQDILLPIAIERLNVE